VDGRLAAAAGLGAFASAGGRAAAVGADLTNQMGVGHNTYIPDFASSRSRGGNNGGPSDRDNPEINGSGQDAGGDSPGSTMPSPQAPAMRSSCVLPGGGLPGGGAGAPSAGAGAAGGGGAAAGGAGAAAAVPIVPV